MLPTLFVQRLMNASIRSPKVLSRALWIPAKKSPVRSPGAGLVPSLNKADHNPARARVGVVLPAQPCTSTCLTVTAASMVVTTTGLVWLRVE